MRWMLMLTLAIPLAAQTAQTPNAELEKIVKEDQAARQDFQAHLADPNWLQALMKSDAARLARVREMAGKGELRCAKDYSRAALVLQHGDKSDDFLLAHVLATAAVVGGESDAKWLSAATLDRYLRNIGQPQVFGTQYSSQGNEGMTMQPYSEDLLPDAMRAVFGVPALADQKHTLEDMKKLAQPPK